MVEFDAEDGQPMRWTIDRYADPPNDAELTQEQAVEIVRQAVEIPPGAELKSFAHFEYAPKRKVTRLEWRHLHDGLRVDGDYMWILLHPQTKRIIEWARKWRTIRLASRGPTAP